MLINNYFVGENKKVAATISITATFGSYLSLLKFAIHVVFLGQTSEVNDGVAHTA